MRILERMRMIRDLTLAAEGDYDINYGYDVKGRVATETVTGSIQRTTTFTYDDLTDNIVTETIVEDGKTITKTYEYNGPDGGVSKIAVKYT